METGIGEKIKQLRLEHDLTMDMLLSMTMFFFFANFSLDFIRGYNLQNHVIML